MDSRSSADSSFGRALSCNLRLGRGNMGQPGGEEKREQHRVDLRLVEAHAF